MNGVEIKAPQQQTRLRHFASRQGKIIGTGFALYFSERTAGSSLSYPLAEET